MDGWTFFSRSLSALMAGDAHGARNLAYYAQLRAGLSILGCNGIGIFYAINFAIDNKFVVHRIYEQRDGAGTHRATWDALQVWASQPHMTETFLDSMKFHGVSLADCVKVIRPSWGSAQLVTTIIKEWGVDLKRAVDDRDSRNVSSYDPHALNPVESDIDAHLKLICEIWRCLEPGGPGTLRLLDMHLLRKSLRLMKDKISKADFLKLDPGIQKFVPFDFLTSGDTIGLTVFDVVDRRTGDVHAMVCRALLLLRIATLVVRAALVDAGFQPWAAGARLWLEKAGIARGFWPGNMPLEAFSELWDDVNFELSDLEESISSSRQLDQYEFLTRRSSQAVLLSQTERAFMWAVCA